MHRRYDTALYRDKLLLIKSVMPDACIAADIMAGFNGESEEEFRKVLTYVDSLPISYLHVFTYSDRPGTAALRLGEKVPVNVRHEHTARLLELSEKKHKQFIDSQMGCTRPVLWESTPHHTATADRQAPTSDLRPPTSDLRPPTSDLRPPTSALMQGWTDNYIRVGRPYDPSRINTVEKVTITPDNILREEL
jgi:threonylcarbamoyladenosine tRNA methylthiotransferase MtaB